MYSKGKLEYGTFFLKDLNRILPKNDNKLKLKIVQSNVMMHYGVKPSKNDSEIQQYFEYKTLTFMK